MKTLILAAGLGNRMGAAGQNLPKALLRVAGKTLLRHQLEWLEKNNIRSVGVAAGFQIEAVREELARWEKPVHCFENPRFREGSILSLQAALPFLDDDFLLMNVDHLYPARLLPRFLKQLRGMTVACDFDRPLADDDMKVILDEKKRLKAMDKQLKNYDGGYIGITYCPRSRLTGYRAGVELSLNSFGPRTPAEKILNTLVKQGEVIAMADLSGMGWLEIDTPEELQKAEQTLAAIPRFLD